MIHAEDEWTGIAVLVTWILAALLCITFVVVTAWSCLSALI